MSSPTASPSTPERASWKWNTLAVESLLNTQEMESGGSPQLSSAPERSSRAPRDPRGEPAHWAEAIWNAISPIMSEAFPHTFAKTVSMRCSLATTAYLPQAAPSSPSAFSSTGDSYPSPMRRPVQGRKEPPGGGHRQHAPSTSSASHAGQPLLQGYHTPIPPSPRCPALLPSPVGSPSREPAPPHQRHSAHRASRTPPYATACHGERRKPGFFAWSVGPRTQFQLSCGLHEHLAHADADAFRSNQNVSSGIPLPSHLPGCACPIHHLSFESPNPSMEPPSLQEPHHRSAHGPTMPQPAASLCTSHSTAPEKKPDRAHQPSLATPFHPPPPHHLYSSAQRMSALRGSVSSFNGAESTCPLYDSRGSLMGMVLVNHRHHRHHPQDHAQLQHGLGKFSVMRCSTAPLPIHSTAPCTAKLSPAYPGCAQSHPPAAPEPPHWTQLPRTCHGSPLQGGFPPTAVQTFVHQPHNSHISAQHQLDNSVTAAATQQARPQNQQPLAPSAVSSKKLQGAATNTHDPAQSCFSLEPTSCSRLPSLCLLPNPTCTGDSAVPAHSPDSWADIPLHCNHGAPPETNHPGRLLGSPEANVLIAPQTSPALVQLPNSLPSGKAMGTGGTDLCTTPALPNFSPPPLPPPLPCPHHPLHPKVFLEQMTNSIATEPQPKPPRAPIPSPRCSAPAQCRQASIFADHQEEPQPSTPPCLDTVRAPAASDSPLRLHHVDSYVPDFGHQTGQIMAALNSLAPASGVQTLPSQQESYCYRGDTSINPIDHSFYPSRVNTHILQPDANPENLHAHQKSHGALPNWAVADGLLSPVDLHRLATPGPAPAFMTTYAAGDLDTFLGQVQELVDMHVGDTVLLLPCPESDDLVEPLRQGYDFVFAAGTSVQQLVSSESSYEAQVRLHEVANSLRAAGCMVDAPIATAAGCALKAITGSKHHWVIVCNTSVQQLVSYLAENCKHWMHLNCFVDTESALWDGIISEIVSLSPGQNSDRRNPTVSNALVYITDAPTTHPLRPYLL
eukprot:gene7217-1288_t